MAFHLICDPGQEHRMNLSAEVVEHRLEENRKTIRRDRLALELSSPTQERMACATGN